MLNVVALVGRVVADPELRYTPSGIAVTSFRIAVDRGAKSETGESQADFIDIVAWRQSAEFAANYLNKGRLVAVSGRLQQRSWVQQDGQRRSKVEVVAHRVQGIGPRKEGQVAEAAGAPAPEEVLEAPPDEVMAGAESDMDYDPFADE